MTDPHLLDAALTTLERAGATLDTLAKLAEHCHGIDAYCPRCQRWRSLDVPRLVRLGFGRRRLVDFRPRCRECGERGTIQVRPPTPAWTGYFPK